MKLRFSFLLAFGILMYPVFADSLTADTLVFDSLAIDTVTADTANSTVLVVDNSKQKTGNSELFSSTSWVFIWLIIGTLLLMIFVLAPLKGISKTVKKDDSEYSKSVTVEAEKEGLLIRKVLISLVAIFVALTVCWFYIKGTPMEGHAKEWMNLIVRWAHVIAGISWIGASFYFIFLENALNRTKGLSDELAGNLWAIHGGGFYYLEKFKGAPEKLPKELHWFKYEAYFTWLSGFALMWIVYYADAKAFLVDPMILDISSELGIAIGIGSMVFSWLIYDALCKTKLVEKRALFGLVGFGLFVLIEWALCEVMNPRAAYIHAGALLGTCMVANVFFVIIPSQKALVKAAKLNQPLDPKLGKNAGLRSLHNNYITLPVLFIMISNHFPSTFGHEHNWLILAGLALASAGIKHYWNLYEAGKSDYFMLGISIAALVVIFLLTAPVSREEKLKDAPEVSFIQVNDIIQRRCISCHSASPTDDTWTAAPNGVMYDTPQQIVKMQDKILQRAVLTKNMPQGNKTGMTQEERDVLEIWIYQGAKTDF